MDPIKNTLVSGNLRWETRSPFVASVFFALSEKRQAAGVLVSSWPASQLLKLVFSTGQQCSSPEKPVSVRPTDCIILKKSLLSASKGGSPFGRLSEGEDPALLARLLLEKVP